MPEEMLEETTTEEVAEETTTEEVAEETTTEEVAEETTTEEVVVRAEVDADHYSLTYPNGKVEVKLV